MSPLVRSLYEETIRKDNGAYHFDEQHAEIFAGLIIKQFITLLQQQWYELNDDKPVENETLRDIGIRVGKKSELIHMIEVTRTYFGVK